MTTPYRVPLNLTQAHTLTVSRDSKRTVPWTATDRWVINRLLQSRVSVYDEGEEEEQRLGVGEGDTSSPPLSSK